MAAAATVRKAWSCDRFAIRDLPSGCRPQEGKASEICLEKRLGGTALYKRWAGKKKAGDARGLAARLQGGGLCALEQGSVESSSRMSLT